MCEIVCGAEPGSVMITLFKIDQMRLSLIRLSGLDLLVKNVPTPNVGWNPCFSAAALYFRHSSRSTNLKTPGFCLLDGLGVVEIPHHVDEVFWIPRILPHTA